MSFSEPLPTRRMWVGLLPAAAIVASLAYLAYGPSNASSFATISALLLVPFCLGISITWFSKSYSLLGCLVAPIVLGALSLLLAYAGMEGMVCIAMVMPFWAAGGIGGGLTALWLKRARARIEREDTDGDRPTGQNRLFALGLAVLPLAAVYVETLAPTPWETFEVTRHVDIAASPAQVWPQLVSIPKISSDEGIATITHDWLAIPRPSDARLTQRGGKLVRLATWGRDARFEERITHIEPEKSIAWNFAFPDASIQRYTDRHIDPQGPILRIESGRYRLKGLDDKTTRVSLITRYRARSRLNWYWRLWGEWLLGDVENNVLAIVKQRSEALAAR